ncbi:MAG: hypothetical protein ABI904_03320 [Chloroflexota bacterium]
MKKLISAKLAGNILLASLGLLLVFHILVLLKVVPATMMWGGQATSANLILLEIVALAVTLFFGFVIAAKTGYVNAGKFTGVVKVLVWIIFAFLLLNTLGNLASGVSAENFIFAPITLVLALCALRLAVEK